MTLVHSLAIAALLPLAGTVPRPEPVRGVDGVPRPRCRVRRDASRGHGRSRRPGLLLGPRGAVPAGGAARRGDPGRETARQGRRDLHALESAEFFRARIAHAVRMGAIDITSAAERDDDVVLEVHAVLPWGAGAPASARLVGLLPPLPAELEYRFVGRHLVLLDVEANLVVDVLREAVPARHRDPREQVAWSLRGAPGAAGVLDVTPRTIGSPNMTASASPATKTVFWHRELPPLEAEPIGEHVDRGGEPACAGHAGASRRNLGSVLRRPDGADTRPARAGGRPAGRRLRPRAARIG